MLFGMDSMVCLLEFCNEIISTSIKIMVEVQLLNVIGLELTWSLTSLSTIFQSYHLSQYPFAHFLAGFFLSILDPDQARQNIRPELDPNCLPKLSVDEYTRESYIPTDFDPVDKPIGGQ